MDEIKVKETRRLVTLRKIKDIKPIEGADRIEAYLVDGWWVVDQKGKYNIGDDVLYCEIDSWIPHDIAPFLSKGKKPQLYNGVVGERLRTARFKGQLSQGLLLDVSFITKYKWAWGKEIDYAEMLGVIKWEAPIPVQLSGKVKSNFPSFFPKTDQERVQNLEDSDLQDVFEVTEKLDGTSVSFYLYNDTFGVCSRNWDLEETKENLYWQVARREQVEEKMRKFSLNGFVLQGEVVGYGIQNNKYSISPPTVFIYNVYHIPSTSYISGFAAQELVDVLELKYVPVIGITPVANGQYTIEDFIEHANKAKSILKIDALAEGYVFKSLTNPNKSFKVISNEWLLKYGG